MRRERDVEKFDRPAKIDLPLGVSAEESSGAGEGTGETPTGEAEGTEAATLEQAWKEEIARLQDPNTPLTEVMAAARQAALMGSENPELDAVVTARLEQAWKEEIARLQDPNTPLTEVMAAARQAALLGGADAGLPPELDAVVTARLEQAWKDQIARLQDPNTPLTEVVAAARQAALLGGADAGLPPELDAVVTARLEQAWKDGMATGGAPATAEIWTGIGGSSSGTSASQGGTPAGVDTGISSPTSEPDVGGSWEPPSGRDWPDWGSGTGSSDGSPSAGGDDPGSPPPDIVDASDDVLSGGDDADVPPDRVDAGGGTSSSTSGSRSGGGGTVVTADDEAELVEIRPGAMGYIWVENEDGSYTAYDPNTGAPVDGGTSGEEDEEEDEEEEEGTEGESGSEESMPVEGDAGPTTGAVRDRLGLIGGESDRVPVPGYVDPVDPEAGAASESGDLSVVRPGDPHINPDLISLYGPDGGADGSVTVSTSGTPPVLGSAPKDPPKPMPGGDDSVPGGSLTPGSNWGGGDPGGYDPTIAGGNDDDLDDLEIERLTGGGPSTPTQSATSQALGGAGSTIAVPIEGEDGTVDELTIQQLAGAGSSTPSQGLATEALGGYDPTVAGGNDDDLDDLEIERLTGGGPSTPTQSLASDALSGFDQALDAGDPALAGPTPFAAEATSPDIDAGPLPEPGEADALPG